MSTLNEAAFNKACITYADDDGGWEERLKSAIETYMAEIFKPGELFVGEAIEPQRDYRKELWVGVAIAVARSDSTTSKYASGDFADTALAKFDAQFGGAK